VDVTHFIYSGFLKEKSTNLQQTQGNFFFEVR